MIVIYDDCSNNKDDENEYHIIFKIYDVFHHSFPTLL